MPGESPGARCGDTPQLKCKNPQLMGDFSHTTSLVDGQVTLETLVPRLAHSSHAMHLSLYQGTRILFLSRLVSHPQHIDRLSQM